MPADATQPPNTNPPVALPFEYTLWLHNKSLDELGGQARLVDCFHRITPQPYMVCVIAGRMDGPWEIHVSTIHDPTPKIFQSPQADSDTGEHMAIYFALTHAVATEALLRYRLFAKKGHDPFPPNKDGQATLALSLLDANRPYQHELAVYTCLSDRFWFEFNGSDDHRRKQLRVLENWLWYFQEMGAEHFYLVFDFINPEYLAASMKVLQPYIDQGMITLAHAHARDHRPFLFQVALENYFLHFARGHTKWLAMLDVDEYLQLMDQGQALRGLKAYIDEVVTKDPSITVVEFPGIFWDMPLRNNHGITEPRDIIWHSERNNQRKSGGLLGMKGVYHTEKVRATWVHLAHQYYGKALWLHPFTEGRLDHFRRLGHGLYDSLWRHRDDGLDLGALVQDATFRDLWDALADRSKAPDQTQKKS